MSALEFIGSLVDSLAWPVAIIVIVLILRSPLSGLLAGPVKRWKAGPSGVGVEYWEEQLSEARRDLEESPDLAGVEKQPALAADGLVEELRPLTELSPQAAVMESMIRIEQKLRGLVEKVDISATKQPMGATQLAKAAHRSGVISDETLEAIQGMAVLRNLAAHGRAEDLTPERAIDFVSLAEAVLYALNAKTSE